MPIFSFNKENKDPGAEYLNLGQYKKIYSKMCFLDESGTLNVDQNNPFFTVGILSCSQPAYMNREISRERDRVKFYDEMKFNKLGKKNLDFAKFMIDAYFQARSVSFHSYTLDKESTYFTQSFNGDIWTAYKEITMRVLEAIDKPNQIITLLADNITTPKTVRFEVDVKHQLNHKLKRFAVAGVCRLDSKTNDLLQLADLLVGVITYDLKIEFGIINQGSKYKRQLVNHFRKELGTGKKFSEGFRNFNTSIFVDKSILERNKDNEKGPSS